MPATFKKDNSFMFIIHLESVQLCNNSWFLNSSKSPSFLSPPLHSVPNSFLLSKPVVGHHLKNPIFLPLEEFNNNNSPIFLGTDAMNNDHFHFFTCSLFCSVLTQRTAQEFMVQSSCKECETPWI